MKHRAIISAAVMGLLAAASLPAINWADEGDDPYSAKYDEGNDPFSDKILAEHEKQLRKQEKQLHIQAEEMRVQAALAAKDAHKAAEKARMQFRGFFRGPGNPRYLAEINEQAAKYRDAEGEEDKATALSNLNEVIEKCFEDDMKVREQELTSIEQRLNKLRAQLDRRRAKKQEIVDLQVKVAINEADGLGFFSDAKGDVFQFRVPAPVVTPLNGKAFNGTIFQPHPKVRAVGDATGATLSISNGVVVAHAPPSPLGEVHIEELAIEAAAPAKVASADMVPPSAGSAPAPPSPPGPIRITVPPAPTPGGELTIANDKLSVMPPGAGEFKLAFDLQPLRFGLKGDAVRLLQYQLNERLPAPDIAVDGDFGQETEKAVKAFQKLNHLDETGIVDEETRKELDRGVTSPPKPAGK